MRLRLWQVPLVFGAVYAFGMQNLYAATWQWTPQLQSLRSAGARTIAVIEAGDPIELARQAQAELVGSIQQTLVAAAVYGAADLHVNVPADDAQIVAMAVAKRLDRVIVVRAIAQAHQSQVLIVSYDDHGTLVAAELAQAAVSHSPNVASHNQASTDSTSGLRALNQTTSQSAPISASAIVRVTPGASNHPQQMLRIDERSSTPLHLLNVSIPTTPIAHVGRYGFELMGGAIFEELGQPELAVAYQQRETLRTSLLLGGIGVGLSAGACSLAALVVAGSQPGVQPIWYGISASSVLIGGLVGLGLGVAGLLTDPNPVSLPYLRELIDGYNREQIDADMQDDNSALQLN